MTEADHAGNLLEQALAPFYPHEPPKFFVDLNRVGREIWACLEQRIHRERLDEDLCHDIFQTTLFNAVKHLKRHGPKSITVGPRPWLHAIARNATYHHLKELFGPPERPHPPVLSLEALLDGEEKFHLPPAPPPLTHDDHDLERLLLQAITRLEGRHRQFAELQILRGQSPEEIRAAMNLPNDRSYRRLHRQTVKLLIDIVKHTLAYTLASTWVA